MVIKTFTVLFSLMVLLLSPRAPSSLSSLESGHPLGSSGRGLATTTTVRAGVPPPLLPLLPPRQLRRNDGRLRTTRGNDEDKECSGRRGPCCAEPVPKVTPLSMLSLGKFISLETHKHYLVRHVWLMRCPGNYGCCASLREHCAPTETADVTLDIPVEISTGRNQFEYMNESHRFQNHVKCACQKRTHQGLANYISRELLTYYDPEPALDMVHRICKAVQRRIRRLHRFDARFRHNSKRKRRPKRDVC